jgi:hypothetical protein
MKRNGTADQAKRFVELKQQIIATTGLEAFAPRVSYLATLMLQAERLQSRVIAGDDSVTGAELLALRTTIEEISPATPHTVNLLVSKRLHGVCQFCHKLNPLDEPVPPPPEPPSPKPPPGPRLLPPPSAVSEWVDNA